MPREKRSKVKANFDLPNNVFEHISDALKGKTWVDADVLEFADYLLFPGEVLKRRAGGEFERVPVRLRVPREHELRQVRVQARSIMEEDGLDPARDRDLFSNVETFCILAKCIRNADAPHEPWEPDPRQLEKRYDKTSLMAVWAKLDALAQIVDPRPDDLSAAEIIALIAAIAKENSTGPLAVYGSRAQASFVITMAKLCAISLDSKSYLELLADLKAA
jgi:hypothetical protein